MLKLLYSRHLFIADTSFESGMKVLTWKNLYILDRAEKIKKRINLDFDKFLYFRHLESFSTVPNFSFNQSMAFAGPRK